MQEFFTRAWVLERSPVGEADELVTLYTEQFGKVQARARSIRKITSKVSSQLQPLRFSQVRLMRHNGPRDGFSVLDALVEDTRPQPRFIPTARLLTYMTHEWEADAQLWACIERMHTQETPERGVHRELLAILGFDTTHAACMFCKKIPVAGFVIKNHDFACENCASKMRESEVVWI